jgi:hypothetical protein
MVSPPPIPKPEVILDMTKTAEALIPVRLAKRWVAYAVLLSLLVLIGGLGFASLKIKRLQGERDSALAMVSTKLAPVVVMPKAPTEAPTEKIRPASTAVVATTPNTDARVVLIDSVDGNDVFDPRKVAAIKDEVASAVAGCNGDSGRAFELCVKLVSAYRKASPSHPAAPYFQYAALIISKAGLVQDEAEQIVPCFTRKLGKKAVVVEATKYKSTECK